MPSTETRLYADLITLTREIVNEANEDQNMESVINKIWDMANPEEKEALTEFAKEIYYRAQPAV